MTGYTLTQPEVWYAGPLVYQAAGTATAGWVQAAGAVTTAQSLVTAATGASGAAGSDQPYFPAGFWQRPKQVAKIIIHGTVSWVATAATTCTFAVGTSGSTPQGPATAITATNTLWTSPAYPNQSTAQTNIPWHFDLDVLCQKVGVGTTPVSTALLTTGLGGATTAITGAVGVIPMFGPVPGNVLTTFDNSINQFVWVSVTFGTNGSASNTCTMTSCYIYGMN
jgi:hypothetical protein